MTIAEIKDQLSILTVLEHYGLRPGGKHPGGKSMICCPFHDDKTPSMQVYEKTNTVYCFSANCKTHGKSIDVIDFIMHKENITKHQALAKAAEMAGPAAPSGSELEELFKAGRINASNVKGLEYLQSRGLDWRQLKEKHGIRVSYNAVRSRMMRNCVLFPLLDEQGRLVSLYGRSIFDIAGKKHYYSTGRRGLFPQYPDISTRHLVLTESIIDACSLLQHTPYAALALYGTNGLTAEHLEAIKRLNGLEEITLFLDGDPAGRQALSAVATKLKAVTRARISYVETPENEDINSLTLSHEPQILDYLVQSRQPFISGGVPPGDVSLSNGEPPQAIDEYPSGIVNEPIWDEAVAVEKKENPSGKENPPLTVVSPELLIYRAYGLKTHVLGGVRLSGLEKLRATLKIEQEGVELPSGGVPLRHSLDLYHALQLEALQSKIREHFNLESTEITHFTEGLISSLEHYRSQRMQPPKKQEKYSMSAAEKLAALAYLQAPDLMQRTAESIAASGLIGEQTNALTAFLIYTSRKREHPLHLICLGASGTGKTYLQEKVGALMPPEDKLEITTLSENAFYYFGKEELKHKLILIEDLDGATEVLYPLRELQSKRRISKTVTLKDSKGNLKTVTLTVEGPVSVSGCTTREKLYEDNANRCILIETDQSPQQDSRIMDYQRRASAGLIDKAAEAATQTLLQNVQRLLRPLTVRNPYAPHIHLPQVVFKPRRTAGLLLSFIETVTFYHQYQLTPKHDPATGETYIQTRPEHIIAALELLTEVLFRKSDELSGATRKFLETLKTHLKEKKLSSFTAKEIRKTLRMNPSNLKRYLLELERYGYLKGKGNRYRGYEYSITDISEYENLTHSIQADLQQIIAKVSGSVAQG